MTKEEAVEFINKLDPYSKYGKINMNIKEIKKQLQELEERYGNIEIKFYGSVYGELKDPPEFYYCKKDKYNNEEYLLMQLD